MRQTVGRSDRVLAAGIAGVGGLALVGSVAALLQAAWRQGLVGPGHAVGGSVLLGIVGLLAAEGLWIGRWRPASLALSGASVGIIALSLFAANAWYGWIGAPVAVGLLATLSALGSMLATRRDSELLACLALITVGTAPGLLWAGVGAQLGLAVVALSAVAATVAAVQRDWRLLATLSVLGGAAVWGTVAVAGSCPPSLIVASASIAGCAFALGALRTRRSAWPLGIGASIALLIVVIRLPTPPLGGLAALGLVGGGLQQISLRSERSTVAAGIGLLEAICTLVVLVLLLVEGATRPSIPTLLVFSVPFLAGWAAGVSAGSPPDGSYQGQLLVNAMCASIAQVSLMSTEPEAWYAPLVMVPLVSMGWLASVVRSREGGLEVSPGGCGLVPAATLLASLVLLLPWGWAWLRIVLGLALLGLALIHPVLPVADRKPELRWSTLLIAVAPAGALALAWGEGVGFAWGLPVLAASGLATLGGLGSRRLEPDEAEIARGLYSSLSVGLAILSVPAQIQGASWTVGWALIVIGLVIVEEQLQISSLRWVPRLLAAGVASRLLLVPGLLSHEGVMDPSPWVGLSYLGSGGLLLAAAALSQDRRTARWSVDAATVVGFALLNVQLSHAVAGGWLLTSAPVAARTALWAGFALALMALSARPAPRRAGLVMLALVAAKVISRDLWLVDGVARAGLLLGVAACFLISAALLYRGDPAGDPQPGVAPSSVAPSSVAPSSVAPSSVAPSSVAPSSVAPSSVAPS
ncbi:MAG TPA: DUF2339 domain-containing protein, partial [Deltaproteobacteria bacterium]|nr:DUF2339 domain-containing protein [Deltaproteobacteria bacterium]